MNFENKITLMKDQRDGRKVINLDGFIGQGFFTKGITAEDFGGILEEAGAEQDLLLTVNSGGGSVFEAVAIAQKIAKHQGDVKVEIEGVAASAMVTIIMAADSRVMADNALLMIHESSSIAFGNKRTMQKTQEVLGLIDEMIVNQIVNVTGQSRKKIQKMVEDETWMNAKKAKELGFIDSILPSSKVEKHITPEDRHEREFEDIYEKMAQENEETADIALRAAADAFNDRSFRQRNRKVEKFTTEPWDMKTVGDAVNVNELRWRSVCGDELAKEKLERWKLLDSQNAKEIQLSKIEIKAKGQIYPLSTREVKKMNLILSELGVESVDEAVDAIKDLKDGKVTNTVIQPQDSDETRKLRQSVELLTSQIEAMQEDKEKEKTRQRDAEINQLVTDGYIKPAEREFYESLYDSNQKSYGMVIENIKKDEPRWAHLTETKGHGKDGEKKEVFDNNEQSAEEKFNAKVLELQNEKKIGYKEAYALVQNEHPEIYQEFHNERMAEEVPR